MFDKKEYNRQYYIKNKIRLEKVQKQYRIDNREHRKELNKQWRIDNRERRREYNKQYERIRRGKDSKYSIGKDMSRAIRYSLKGNKNGHHWEKLVGYTCNDLIKHLKKTLPKSYTWNDFLEGKLHIDHIIPKSVFNFSQPEHQDFKKCWALKNLRLLPAKENLIKSNKLTKPFQPALRIEVI